MTLSEPVLRIRWLGRTSYSDVHALQHGVFGADPGGLERPDDWLLLCEHNDVYTLGVRTDPANVLPAAAASGAEMVTTDRGGDVTYHGPGQLVGYPVRTLPQRNGGAVDTPAWVYDVEQLVIDAVKLVGLDDVGRLDGCPGVWVAPQSASPRKVAAIGVRISRGRSMHGFALNVDPDMAMFTNIVPCGIANRPVTSLAAEGVDVSMHTMVDAVANLAAERWAPGGGVERADVVWKESPADLSAFSRGAGPGAPVAPDGHTDGQTVGATAGPTVGPTAGSTAGPPHDGLDGTSVRLARRRTEAGVATAVSISERKPQWLRARVDMGDNYRRLKGEMRDLGLVTVCEEAGCPNIYECWSDGTATFMINGERCTRACGFCLVDTRRPAPLDPGEPQRVAEAVRRLGLQFAVVTAVARDDLPDGGAGGFAATIEAIRTDNPGVHVEVLIPDLRGDATSLDVIFGARPDVLNHNIETVARLQRAARPSAGYARSLSVLARAKKAGLVTKSGLIVGLGETDEEVRATLGDLAGVGVDIVTIGQYLRPTSNHLPVARWVTPETFGRYAQWGLEMGIGHVESSPLTRSSYHARSAAEQVTPGSNGVVMAPPAGSLA